MMVERNPRPGFAGTGAARYLKDGVTARRRSRTPWSAAGKVTIGGLVFAAAGVLSMLLSGVEFRTVPPGLFILLTPAILMVVGRWRWTPAVAALAGLFIFAGYFPSGSVGRLLELSRIGEFAGLWMQFVGSLVALVAGVVATMTNYRSIDGRSEL